MDRLQTWGRMAALVAGTALAFGIKPVVAQTTLVVNGNSVPADVRPIGGTAFVRLSDVAKALGLIVVKHGTTYELTKAGGANQVEGLNGKLGDVLFDGRWRFQVLSLQTVDSYTIKSNDAEPYGLEDTDYNSATRALTPKSGHTLIMLQCRLKNGQKSTQTLWIPRNDTHTALTDTDGQSYPPILYDLDGAPTQTKPLLPGSKLDFSLFFSVPTGTQIKDLVFTLHNNDSSQTPNDVRVSLQAP